MTRSDASLKGKVKAMAKKSGLKPQELLQMYLFERLLMRLEKSDYAETFVLKGGLLISSMTGVAQRTTMDMDATVVGMDMDAETVNAAISSICSVDIGDGMEYSFERLEPIRTDDEYANWRAHLRARYGKIDAPIKIDITTGDEIVPGRIEYSYPLMFEEGSDPLLPDRDGAGREARDGGVARHREHARSRLLRHPHAAAPEVERHRSAIATRSDRSHDVQARVDRQDVRLRSHP